MLYRLVYSVLQFLKRHPNFIRLSVLAVVVLAIASIVSTKIYQHWDNDPDRGAIGIERHTYDEGSSTPQYLKEKYSTPQYLDQGWSAADSLWFYTTTQGSALLPYDFFLVLERANSAELFKSDQNIDRFRYLPQKKTFFNPDALPVGFVKTTYDGKDYVGFTCAACHTAQINYKDPAPGSDDKPAEALRIDGGPAMADMVGFLTELRKAMQAAQSGDKQKTFVKNVVDLGNNYRSPEAVNDDLKKWTKTIHLYNIVNDSEAVEKSKGGQGVKYGHARLDAFGRIYNRVLQHAINGDQVAKQLALIPVREGTQNTRLSRAEIGKVMEGLREKIVLNDDDFSLIIDRLQSPDAGYPHLEPEDLLSFRNHFFNSPNAPVSYPFLWDIAHSDYVQWNGLANNAGVGPLGRNAGEVIGVFGILDWGKDTSWLHPYSWFNALAAWASGQKDKKEVIEFKSSINLFNLQRLESSLRSLKSPQWPFCRNAKGEYYLPADKKDPTSPVDKRPCFGKDEKINKAWSKNGESIYLKHCVHCHTLVDREDWDRVVVGNVTKLSKIGTDQAMAWNSVNYMGWSGNFKDTYQETSVGDVVVEEHAPVLQILTAATRGVVATPDHGKGYIRRFVEWIYIIVATIGDNTIKKKSVKKGNYDPDTTSRPYDSLLAYRARSLNGIWATAPYLHNGSVPTLYDLLLPASQRPSSFQVGGREFDPDKVGFKSKGLDFTTDEPGNKNTGHLYGTGMSDDERRDLLEYLKSL